MLTYTMIPALIIFFAVLVAFSASACPPTPSQATHGQSSQRYGAFVGQVNTGSVTSVQRQPLRTRSRSGNTISSVAIGNSSFISISRSGPVTSTTPSTSGNNGNGGNPIKGPAN